jgi:hypothetical protein
MQCCLYLCWKDHLWAFSPILHWDNWVHSWVVSPCLCISKTATSIIQGKINWQKELTLQLQDCSLLCNSSMWSRYNKAKIYHKGKRAKMNFQWHHKRKGLKWISNDIIKDWYNQDQEMYHSIWRYLYLSTKLVDDDIM